MTDDPADLKVRVNMDLAAFIPAAGTHQEAARDFLQFLFQPEKIAEYNASQLGFTPTTEAAPPDDPRIEGMIEYYNNGQFYQGPSVLVPKTIPVFNYTQAMVLGDDAAKTLAIMDADWARLAFRQPAPTIRLLRPSPAGRPGPGPAARQRPSSSRGRPRRWYWRP